MIRHWLIFSFSVCFSLQAQLVAYKSVGVGAPDKSGYRHNQQLEELRNLQDKFSGEKAAWAQLRDNEQRDLEQRRQELIRLQEQMRAEENDIKQQRDQLYRKMEILTNQGLLISPNVSIPTLSHDENHDDDNDTKRAKPDISKWLNKQTGNKLPMNLISATNQVKVSTALPVKQQLPLKLASKLSSAPVSTQVSPSNLPQQMLPLRLSQQEEKIARRSSSSGGYQRLGSGSFSPPNGVSLFIL